MRRTSWWLPRKEYADRGDRRDTRSLALKLSDEVFLTFEALFEGYIRMFEAFLSEDCLFCLRPSGLVLGSAMNVIDRVDAKYARVASVGHCGNANHANAKGGWIMRVFGVWCFC